MAICKGCGITLQYTDATKPGYTPKKDSAYCQRCFRIMHYDDLVFSLREAIDKNEVIQTIHELPGKFLWIIDLYDFESSMIPELEDEFQKRDVFVVCTKRDLLPKSVKEDKLKQFVLQELKQRHIKPKELCILSLRESVEDLKERIHQFSKGEDILVVGRANVGKSTLINRLLQRKDLTSSRYPGTTQACQKMEIDGITYIDTPGIEIENNMIMKVKEEDLVSILPMKEISPRIFQIHEDQTFIIGGLAIIDLQTHEEASIVFYQKNELKIHRCKPERKQANWQQHYGEEFVPIPMNKDFITVIREKEYAKEDVVIAGLGFLCISGPVDKICVTVPKDVTVTFRKAMI